MPIKSEPIPDQEVVQIVSGPKPEMLVSTMPLSVAKYNLDQSTDIAERSYNAIDYIIRFMEATAAVLAQYNGMGGPASLDLYFQNAPTTGPSKEQLVNALVSCQSLLNFINTGHNINFYQVKSKGSSLRLP